MSTGGGQTTQTVQQNASPWAPAQPYLQDLFGQAQGTYQNAQGQAGSYPNDVAPFSPITQQALGQTAQLAQSGGPPIVGTATNALTNILQGQTAPGTDTLQSLTNGYANPGADYARNIGTTANNLLGQEASTASINPYLQSMFSAAAQPVTDAVNSQFEAGGRSGSGANQQELTRNLGQLASTMYGQNYNQAVQNQMGAANSLLGTQQNVAGLLNNDAANQANVRGSAAQNLNNNFNTQNQQTIGASAYAVPQLADQSWQALQNLGGVGQAYDQQNQNLLNNNLSAWAYQQQQPWNILDNYSGVLTGLGSLGGSKTGTQTTTQPGQSLFPSLLGGGLGLLGGASSSGAGSIFAGLLGL